MVNVFQTDQLVREITCFGGKRKKESETKNCKYDKNK